MSDLKLIEAVKDRDMTRIKDLIESGSDINQQDEHGWTPLNWAGGMGNLDVVSLLIDKGADVFKVGRDRRTPYMIALAAGHTAVAKFLREAEDRFGGEKTARPEQPYCKAYQLKELRQFPAWTEDATSCIDNSAKGGAGDNNSDETKLSPEDIVFIHQDYTVTRSMWHNEKIVYNQITPDWKEYCVRVLQFKALDAATMNLPEGELS